MSREHIYACLLGVALSFAAHGQTNGLSFRGCQVGDTVVFKAKKPFVMLAKAKVVEITTTNVTVVTTSERVTAAREAILQMTPWPQQPADPARITEPRPPAKDPVVGADPVKDAGPLLPAEVLPLMDLVQAQVLGQFATDENHGKATNYFRATMRDFLAGKISEVQLRAQAAEVLKQIDQYKPERQKDPQYEPYIEMLRKFSEGQGGNVR